jgi:predicted HD phosphohydrolase
MARVVEFRQMKHGTREDYALLGECEAVYAREQPGRIVAALERLGQGIEGYRVSRLEHSLQCATRARRDGADTELVVAALVHDLGDELAPYSHAALAAAILRPYVRPEVTWIVAQHGLFQSYYYAQHYGADRNGRERLRAHPWFEACAAFCERWDQSSFDPDYASDPLASFLPLLDEVFQRKAYDPRYLGAGSESGY